MRSSIPSSPRRAAVSVLDVSPFSSGWATPNGKRSDGPNGSRNRDDANYPEYIVIMFGDRKMYALFMLIRRQRSAWYVGPKR